MAHDGFIRYLLLPELRLLETRKGASGGTEFFRREDEPDGGVPAVRDGVGEHVRPPLVRIEDDPLRGGEAILWVHKRRFSCKPCKLPFTEPVDGVRKGYRTTQRYRSRLLWACEHFSDLKAVRRVYRCSSGLLHRVLYEQLELKRRTRLYPRPTKVGIDEHLFKHDSRLNTRRFVTMVVDHMGLLEAVRDLPLPLPDLIVAGDLVIVPARVVKAERASVGVRPIFDPAHTTLIAARVRNSFGFGIAHLLWAAEMIELGGVPWIEILGETIRDGDDGFVC